MIICHKHKFIFIKTVKTASTSLEIALSKFCGKQDRVTPLINEDEKLRESLKYQSPTNYHLKLNEYTKEDFIFLLKRRKLPKFGRHCDALFIKNRVSTNIWNGYYKFCFDRNPWDKAISLYYWQTRNNETPPTFDSFLNSINIKKISNFSKYTQEGSVIVDDVFKYEELEESIHKISKRINLSIKEYLVKTKHKVRKSHEHYSSFLTSHQRDLIAKICEREIKLLNY